MPKFVLAYHTGPNFSPPADGPKHMEDWKAWMAGLGDAAVDPGLAVGPSKTVGPDGVADGGGANPLAGYTVVQADNIDAAIEIARACPHIALGGTIEVAPDMELPM